MNEPKDRRYFILRTPTAELLVSAANDMMHSGWTPQGGGFYAAGEPEPWCQAMRKWPVIEKPIVATVKP
jgi:hypothetical protein